MSGDSDSGLIGLLLLAVGPASGVGVYMWIQARYRNRAARYRPDQTVAYTVSSLTGDDQPRGRYSTKSGSISGRNENQPDARASVSRMFHGELPQPPDAADDDGEREGDAEPPEAS